MSVSSWTGRSRGLDYKWVALSNTTIAALLAWMNSTIVLIALPDIFRGIHLDPLAPGNTSYLLWLILGFMVVMAVLQVSLGRLGDMFGRVRMFNLGFVIFTVFAALLSITWLQGSAGALWLIGMRLGQGLGGALLYANSSAILTDAFPRHQRGLALGVNSIASVAGMVIGLVVGGVLAPVGWHLVFVISLPIALVASIWSYRSLRELGERRRARIDWWGNATFAFGLVGVMIGITYAIQPYGGHDMGWTSPFVLSTLFGGIAMLGVFCVIETRVAEPMFHLELFGIRAFAAGLLALLLTQVARGGFQFILIIWLQGIWLPEHGYDFARTPLWAGIYMLPQLAGLLLASPVSGWLSDRYGARAFACGGMIITAVSFALLIVMPLNFTYFWFAMVLVLNGIGIGLFAAPNSAAVMNSLPPAQRGAGAGMLATTTNAAQVLSIGIFFTLMIIGLSAGLPHALETGLTAHGVTPADAHRVAQLSPVATLFAAFLGYNPLATLLGPHVVAGLQPAQAHTVVGRAFFPHLISSPFHTALDYAFGFAIVGSLGAAAASAVRGGKYVHSDVEIEPEPIALPVPLAHGRLEDAR